jgi:hypothetical protein
MGNVLDAVRRAVVGGIRDGLAYIHSVSIAICGKDDTEGICVSIAGFYYERAGQVCCFVGGWLFSDLVLAQIRRLPTQQTKAILNALTNASFECSESAAPLKLTVWHILGKVLAETMCWGLVLLLNKRAQRLVNCRHTLSRAAVHLTYTAAAAGTDDPEFASIADILRKPRADQTYFERGSFD